MKKLIAIAACAGAARAAEPVRVVVDMDANRPGIQSSVTVPAGTTVVPGVAVYVYDPEGTHSIRGIGYLGGLDRGISFGHTPGSTNFGSVTGLVGHAGTPITGGGYVTTLVQKGFVGAEVQYVEGGSESYPIPATIGAPIFTVDVQLSGTREGDLYKFYLLDMVSVWRGGQGGAFSTVAGMSLDTGGDSVPDNTQTAYGIDPDVAIPVPPAAFLVDYVDGPGLINIGGCYANCDGSTGAPILNALDFSCFLNKWAAGDPYADCDHNSAPPALNALDFGCFLVKFAAGCS